MMLDASLVTIIALCVLLAMIFMAQPIWLALAASGAIGLLLLDGFNVANIAIGSNTFDAVASYSLLIIPMFVLMGVLSGKAGLAEDLFAVSEKIVGKLPGGLGIATILASAGFSAVTGSSSATVATVGRIAIGEMESRGYKINSAGALVAMGGTLGVLIPPSIIIVIFGSMTGTSIGALLIACVVPAIVTVIAYSLATIVQFKRGKLTEKKITEKKNVSTKTLVTAAVGGSTPSSQALNIGTGTGEGLDQAPKGLSRKNITGALFVLLIFAIVIGGVYGGLFTATESGAIAAVVALLVLIIRLRKFGVRRVTTDIRDSLVDTGAMTSMIFALLAGGAVFGFFLVRTGLPNELVRSVTSWDLNSTWIIIISLVLLLILGCFLDSYTIMIIVVPLIWPILDDMGVNGIWYGLLVVKAIEIGLVTPPFGLNVFVAAGMHKKMTPEGIFKEIFPFVLVEFAVIALLMIFPELITWLPDLASSDTL
ncbi:TRAP transporter large permease [Enteractinococcus helveticum]|uniref:TRAP C4-dicarboxylate transport system permease DctM subunit domain-containing protein n=1 Tax=Enteractinococcus helveticum TaxID=1837282 RepID=A0A1B7M2R8_9MICC|nr:TRAP transporter large permease [Enteractinococcus helveticum]OAV62860.1 hypothetical protein A6F49_04155 [Enteractinococcus helveticum]